MRFNLKKIIPWLKSSIEKILMLHASPHEISLGMALGIFIGIFPTFGFGGLIVVGLAPLIRFNIPAAFIGSSMLGNPFMVPLWLFLGCWVVGIDVASIKSTEQTFNMLFKHYSKLVGLYLVGNAIVSTVVSAIFYGLTYRLTLAYRKKNKRD